MRGQAPNPKDDDLPSDATRPNVADARYSFQPEKLQKLIEESPWDKDPKYFQKVAIAPSAIMKIMMHCHSGVEKGISKGGNPIEVMGMLLGRPDPDTPQTLVVADAFPLPIEGFETRVIADDQDVVNHMIALGESLERTRKEKFMGWYHSHPFDLGDHSHCYMSQTDLSTQLQWQRAEDPHGNPFVAIVVDPLRSAHLQVPQLKAFRAYPPEYTPLANTCPDGRVVHSEQVRLEHWGSCWNRYYELQMEYYMSSTSRAVLEQLTHNYLWMRTLCGNKEDKDGTQQLARANQHLLETKAAVGSASSGAGGGLYATAASAKSFSTRSRMDQPSSVTGASASPARSSKTGGSTKNAAKPSPLTQAVQELIEAASDMLQETSIQKTKEQVFSSSE